MLKKNKHSKWLVPFLALAPFLLSLGASAQAKPATPSITITAPSNGAKVATADDYATQVLNDPWDMNELTDVSKPFQSIATYSVSNGIWTATTNGNQPSFWLLNPGNNGDIHIGRDGNNYMQNLKIDSSKYSNLSFRMNYSKPGVTTTRLVFYWTTGDLLFKTDPTQAYAASNPITILPGWNTYAVNLTTLGTLPGDRRNMTTWEGQITGFEFFFIDDTGGSTIQLDWVRLTGATSNYNITWNATEGTDKAVALFADDDTNPNNGFISTITSGVDAATGAHIWDTGPMFPGNYYVYARMGMDYASMILNDPWDMDQSTDVRSTNGITGLTFGGGIASGTVSQTGASYLELNVDPNRPLDPSIFKTVSFRLSVRSYAYASLWWHDNSGWGHADLPAGAPPFNPGWNTYSLDLSNQTGWNNGLTKDTLRFYPAIVASNDFQLDWLAISTTAAGNDLAILSTVVTAYSAAPLAINNPTRLTFTAPSYTSGEDYAASTRGSAWDMNSLADVWTTPPPAETSIDLNNFSVTSGVANFQNTSPNSKLYFHGPENVPINSAKYRYFTYRFLIDGTQDLGPVGGWVGRVIWYGPLGYSNTGSGYTGDEAVTQDWALQEGWTIYNIDLVTAPLEIERVNHSTWTSVQQHALRLTPNEGTLQQTMHLDYAKLTARDVADQSYTIRWNTVNLASNPVTILLYFDTDQNPANGRTPIGTVTGNPGNYVWDTSGLPSGQTLYISGDVDDGWNTTTWYSEAPLVINRAATVNVTEPNGTNDRVTQGNDYATKVRNDPWDMSQSTDVAAYGGIMSPTFNGGMFSGTANATGASYFDLSVASTAIDPATYRNLTFRMYSGNQVPGGYSIWWHDKNGSWSSWNAGTTVPGWNIYSLDLSSQPSWNNGVSKDQFRIYPAINAGNSFQVDWVKLLQPNSATFNIQWTATNTSGATISLYYDTVGSGAQGNLIVAGLAGSTTSYNWDVSFLDLGNYYVYAKIDNNVNPVGLSYGSGPLSIVSASSPTLAVSPPSFSFLALTGTNPAHQTLVISNSGTGSFSWTTTAPSWVTLTPNNGSTEPTNVTVSVQSSGMANGTYNGEIVVNGGIAGTATIPVTLIVTNQIHNLYLPLILR